MHNYRLFDFPNHSSTQCFHIGQFQTYTLYLFISDRNKIVMLINKDLRLCLAHVSYHNITALS